MENGCIKLLSRAECIVGILQFSLMVWVTFSSVSTKKGTYHMDIKFQCMLMEPFCAP